VQQPRQHAARQRRTGPVRPRNRFHAWFRAVDTTV